MNKESRFRDESTHLYNPKKEGLSSYDINYKNALKKNRSLKDPNKIFNIKNTNYAV